MRVVTEGWACQLLHTERLADGVLLDLVALDPCPFDGVDVPAHSPLVIRVVNEHVDACAGLVESWADDVAILSLRFLEGPSARWLCVSAANRHLLLEVC